MKQKRLMLILGVFLFGGALLIYSLISSKCNYVFEATTFSGTTAHGTVIVLDIESVDGVITGSGFHYFKKGQMNNLKLLGVVNCKTGEFSFSQHYRPSGKYFGKIEGKIVKSNLKLTGNWTNSKGLDDTYIRLDTTTQTRQNVLASLKKTNEEKTFGTIVKTIIDGSSALIYDSANDISKWFDED